MLCGFESSLSQDSLTWFLLARVTFFSFLGFFSFLTLGPLSTTRNLSPFFDLGFNPGIQFVDNAIGLPLASLLKKLIILIVLIVNYLSVLKFVNC